MAEAYILHRGPASPPPFSKAYLATAAEAERLAAAITRRDGIPCEVWEARIDQHGALGTKFHSSIAYWGPL